MLCRFTQPAPGLLRCEVCGYEELTEWGPHQRHRPCGQAPAKPTDCRHRSAPIGVEQCPGCRGTVKVKVFDCTLLGVRCALSGKIPGVTDCGACGVREA